jgi:DNA segregation ATPase FtsK/SpoIIIE, S-DNA-T family
MTEAHEHDNDMGELVQFPRTEPVVGELVDADHDGLPDTSHASTPGELAERPDTEVVDIGPVVDGEVIENTAVAVDQPNVHIPTSALVKRAERRPIVAPWLRSAEDTRAMVAWTAGNLAHSAGYHVLRVPLYVGKLTLWTLPGLCVSGVTTARWVFDSEAAPLRQETVRKSDVEAYIKLSERRNKRVKVRGAVAGTGTALVVTGGVLAWFLAPVWLLFVLGLITVTVFGLIGAPRDKPIAGPAVVVERYQRLTSEMVERALGSLGIGAMTAKGARINFTAPIQRDPPGWRAEVDLPYGVTASDVIERRDRLAAGLRRPLGCVWPEPLADQHPGRLVLWVGDEDMNKATQAPWPLRKARKASMFDALPFGTDNRGRPVGIDLMYSNLLIGALPGAGKTFALRVVVLGAAMDPTCELRVYELKGSGDLDPVECISHHYGSGADDDTAADCVSSLREVYADLEKRAATVKRMSKIGRAPENKVTPELAAERALGLWPLLFVIDECQELFTHPEYSKEAERLCIGIIKRGRALGIMLALATQRPDAKSLPTAISANMGMRFCLRVAGQLENDMILGTSKYQQGVRATMLRPSDKGVGWLVGASDEPQISRGYYLDNPDSVKIVQTARLLREQAGTLTGAAVGEERHTVNVLDDVRAVFGTEEKLWTSTVLDRLAGLRPEIYTGWSAEQLAAALRPFQVRSAQVWATTESGKGANRQGYVLAELPRGGTP